MSAFPGKVMVDGVVELAGEKVFALQFLQARNADWVRRPFYAKFDPVATWLDELVPAFGEKRFFFQQDAVPTHEAEPIARIGQVERVGQARPGALETVE
jgi:hypothetical protein